jgi:lysophospholipase L1-like esterase
MPSTPSARAFQRSLAALDALLVALLWLLPALWLLQSVRFSAGRLAVSVTWGWKPLAAVALVAFARLGAARRRGGRGLLERPAGRRAALVPVSILIFLVVAEAALRLTGFQAAAAPIVVAGEHGGTPGTAEAIVPDLDLIWRFNPGAEFNGRRVNALGFLDREVDAAKKPGTIRVICMGDSVAGQGVPPYSGMLHQRLTNAPPTPQPWEAFNMAVHGYSAVQGLRLFLDRGRMLRPDVVTIHYGWNDHWIYERPDANRMAVRASRPAAALLRRLQARRLGQCVLRLLRPSGSLAWSGRGPTLRVPPDEYRRTLVEFVAAVRAAGALPALVTAPRATKLSGVLVKNRQTASVEEAARLHDRYVAITREAATRTGAPLLDLDRQFPRGESDEFFERDGIHFVRSGRGLMADAFYRFISDLAHSPAWPPPPAAESRPAPGGDAP